MRPEEEAPRPITEEPRKPGAGSAATVPGPADKEVLPRPPRTPHSRPARTSRTFGQLDSLLAAAILRARSEYPRAKDKLRGLDERRRISRELDQLISEHAGHDCGVSA